MRTDAMRKAQKKYTERNGYRVSLMLNKKTDTDIINRLMAEPNKQGFIKAVIRKIINEEAHETKK